MYFGLRLFLLFSGLFSLSPIVCDAACVWRVTASNGNIMYLGGSIHGLSSTDYPIPSAYNHAFDASSRLVFEDSPDVSPATVERFYKSGFYPKNDRLKNHVDPRTYAYLCRIFALWNVPEAQFQRLRPWMLLTALASAATNPLGVEGFLLRRARANRIPVSGLESFHEHMATNKLSSFYLKPSFRRHPARLLMTKFLAPGVVAMSKRWHDSTRVRSPISHPSGNEYSRVVTEIGFRNLKATCTAAQPILLSRVPGTWVVPMEYSLFCKSAAIASSKFDCPPSQLSYRDVTDSVCLRAFPCARSFPAGERAGVSFRETRCTDG